MGMRIVNTPPVGVYAWGHSKEPYLPSRDNPPAVIRAGSTDAFQKPSKDFAGNLRPYWGNTGE